MRGAWWLAPAVATAVLATFLLLPPVGAITDTGMKTAGVFFFTVILWIFAGIGYPSLISIALFVLLELMTPTEFWNTLDIPHGMNPTYAPHPTNPLSGQTWWRW